MPSLTRPCSFLLFALGLPSVFAQDAPKPAETPPPASAAPVPGVSPQTPAGSPSGPGGGFGRRGFGGGMGLTAADPGASPLQLDPNNPTLQFPNNPVTDLLTAYELLTGMTLVKDTTIFDGAPISLVTQKPVSKEEAVRLIEATLLINGYAIVSDPGGKSARIMPTRGASAAQLQFSQGVKFYQSPNDLPSGETLVTYFMKLDHLTPDEAGTILSGHVGLNAYGRITPVATPPGLLITESASMVRHLIEIKDTIDSSDTTSSLVTKFVKLTYADATTVSQIVQATIDAQAKDREAKGLTTIRGQPGPERRTNSGDNRGNQPPQQQQQSAASAGGNRGDNHQQDHLPQPTSQVVADSRLNQILIVSTAEDYAYIVSLIQEFDKPVEVPEPYERQLNYAYAIDVISVLADLLKDPTGTGATQLPGGGTLSQNQQTLLSSSSNLLSGRTTQNRRGATRASSTGATTGTDGSTTTSGGVGSQRADQLIAPQEDNAPISVMIGKTRIIADPPSNTIYVMGSKEAVDKVNAMLDKLDRKPAQVYLSTVIGQLTLGDGIEFGVDYLTQFHQTGGDSGYAASSIFRRNDIITNQNISDMRDNIITTPFGPATGLNLYGQIAEGVEAYLNALQTSDRFHVLSRPSVFALNNKKAVITSGQQYPVPYQSVTTPGNVNTNGTVTTTVEFKDVVLKLEVVPLISPNGEVTLDIAQINDNIVGTQRVEPNDVPIIGTEQLTTTVTVPSGNTVVLGGLISDSKTKNDAGIPGLSRIPLLGNLFKNTKNSQDRKELIVFIQPNVVNNENELHKWSHNEDLRTSVGAEVAETFPNEVKPLPPQQPKETRKSWIKRLFSSDIDRERRSEHNPVKGRP